MSKALICVDFINDILDEKGKLAGKGYYEFSLRHRTREVLLELRKWAQASEAIVIHVGVGFDPDYLNHPKQSMLFGGAEGFEALRLGSWGTEFIPQMVPRDGELVIRKPRVSAFFGTPLESALSALQIREVAVAGVATDLAVAATVLDGHDRDLKVSVVSDACAAADEASHQSSLVMMAKVAEIVTLGDLR